MRAAESIDETVSGHRRPWGEGVTDQPSTPAECPVCASHGPFARHTLREMLFGTHELFGYAGCPACGLLWLPDQPPDMSRYYPDSYHAGERPPDSTPDHRRFTRLLHDALATRALFGTDTMAARLAQRAGVELRPEVESVGWLVKQARLRSFDDPILDVGAGPDPERLRALRAAGFRNLLGIDPYAQDAPDAPVPVLRRSIHEMSGAYAMITLHHSFEHMPDPREAMRAAARLLAPRGTLVIRTPVMGSWFWDHYGVDWWELDPPRHLFVHTRRSLELLAAEAGLDLVRVAYDSTFVEILASEQIRQDIAWRSPGSWFSRPPGPFSEATIEQARVTTERLNREGLGGRAIYFFRAPGARGQGSSGASRDAGAARPNGT